MVQEALEGLVELVVRGVRASADPGEAAGKAGAGLRALGAWVERLAGEGSVAGNARREPNLLRAEVPVETGRMSVGIPSAVGVLDPGDFPEAFVGTKEPEGEAALAEGDSFLMVDGPWGPVVVPEEVAVRVEVAGEGAVMEVPVAAEKLEIADMPVAARLVALEPETDVKVTVPEETVVLAGPVGEEKEPIEEGRDAVEWRMPETVAVAPPSRGPRVVMRLMLLVLLVLVGWLAYKAVVLKW